MDKRTLTALLLIMILWFISEQFLWKNKRPVNTKQTTQVTKKQTQSEAIKTDNSITDSIFTTLSSENIENNNITLETNDFKLVFSNKGATLIKAVLPEYTLENNKDFVQLIPSNKSLFGNKITFENKQIDLSQVIFDYQISQNSVSFFLKDKKDENKKIIEKTYSLKPNYTVEFTLKTNFEDNITAYTLDVSSGINDTESYLKYKGMDYKVVALNNNEIIMETFQKIKSKLSKGKMPFSEEEINIDWITLRSKFFMFGIIPDEKVTINNVTFLKDEKSPAFILESKFDNSGYSNLEEHYTFYIGPVVKENLEQFGNGFIRSSELLIKWYKPFTRIFANVLEFINKFVHNYGITIILFALFIKLLLFYFTHKSFESSQAMQKIQPQIKEVQAKYKNDPKQLQIELNRVYKENGVNPLEGCLPLLLQMPVLFSLYPVLRYSISLRQVKFLWMHDLSSPDTFLSLPFSIPIIGDSIGVLPVLMAIFMFVQQKMMMPQPTNEAEMDEKQLATMQSQKMMLYMMPIMMFVIFNNFASGLVLYWTVFNILSLIQQIFIKKQFGVNKK